MSKIRYTAAITAALATTLALAACSPSPLSGPMSSTNPSRMASPETTTPAANTDPHNDSDIAFATNMVPHHQQAVQMADMILNKSGIDPKVVALAKKIKAAQGPEITTMTSWLTTWGSPLEDMSGMSGMATGPGMMSDNDMSALDSASGLAASKLFLQQMTQHHEGAIGMAKTEIASGQNAEALALAKNIVKTQSAEIAEMKSLLKSL